MNEFMAVAIPSIHPICVYFCMKYDFVSYTDLYPQGGVNNEATLTAYVVTTMLEAGVAPEVIINCCLNHF